MIKAKNHKWHVEAIGGIEEFEFMIETYHKVAPWLSDEEIEEILDEEERVSLSPAFWYLS